MPDANTVTVRIWRGRHNDQDGDPDEAHEVELHNGNRREADTVRVNDDVRDVGWLAFDVVDLPDGVDEVTLFVHATNSFHNPDPLNSRAVERGLVFDGRPYKPGIDAPCYRLEGVVEFHVANGAR
jgi:hypothetical protein